MWQESNLCIPRYSAHNCPKHSETTISKGTRTGIPSSFSLQLTLIVEFALIFHLKTRSVLDRRKSVPRVECIQVLMNEIQRHTEDTMPFLNWSICDDPMHRYPIFNTAWLIDPHFLKIGLRYRNYLLFAQFIKRNAKFHLCTLKPCWLSGKGPKCLVGRVFLPMEKMA